MGIKLRLILYLLDHAVRPEPQDLSPMYRVYRLVVLPFLCLFVAPSAFSQDIYEQYYGSGVHAYFAGNYERAEEYFNNLIDAGSQDPRVYYFRGLTQIQSQGCMIEIGFGDFEQAAQLEASGKRSADVSKALSRIQGPTRTAIERIRAKARFSAKSLQADAAQMSGAAGFPNNSAAPLGPNATPNATEPFAGDSGLTGGEPKPMPAPSDAPSSLDSPFGNPPASDAISPTPEPAMPAPDATNPFGDDAAPAPIKPTPTDNPFGT